MAWIKIHAVQTHGRIRSGPECSLYKKQQTSGLSGQLQETPMLLIARGCRDHSGGYAFT